jgi:hypothetical protein
MPISLWIGGLIELRRLDVHWPRMTGMLQIDGVLA